MLDSLLRVCFAATLFLLALALVMALGLICLKLFRRGWRRYAASREEIYKAAILRAIADQTDALIEPLFLERRRILDRQIVEESLLGWSRSLSGYGLKRLYRIFIENGFADYERKRLRSLRWRVRARAAKRLGAMRCGQAQPELIQALKDPKLEVRLTAAWALGKIGDPGAALAALGEAGPSEPWRPRAGKDQSLRGLAARWLEQLEAETA